MSSVDLSNAIDGALDQAMATDERIVVIGEDVPALRRGLLTRYGPDRVMEAPISESAFLGAGVGAALGGLRPVVEIMFVDFLSVALHPLANEAAMASTFSGGDWSVPLVVRSACGGGYGDAGQHEQALWGQIAGIPGVAVAVPACGADAAGLTLSLLDHAGPSVLLEHKLLSQMWRHEVAGSHRETISLAVPEENDPAPPPGSIDPVPLGRLRRVREGTDVVVFTLAMGVHRSIEAAELLAAEGIEVGVIDLRTVSPLDVEGIRAAAEDAQTVLVVDEDYLEFGLSGEVAAVLCEGGIHRPFRRVATTGVIPYARHLEDQTLPSVARIVAEVRRITA